MADAVLSVELRAKLEKLSKGLKDGEKNIGDFVAAGDRNLSKIEAKFESLGKTTKDIASNIKSALGGISMDKYMEAFSNSQGDIAKARAEIQKYKAEIEQLKKVGQELSNQIKEKTAALNADKQATEQARTATEKQRTATEAERTESARLKNELQALRNEKARNRQETIAATGSYREAQQRLTALGKQIRENANGFNINSREVRIQINEYNKLNAKLKEFDRAMGNHHRNIGNYGSAFAGAIPYIGQFTSVAGLASLAVSGLTKSFETNMKLDALNVALKETSGSAENFDTNMKFLRVSADRLGLDFVTTANAFKLWQGAAKFSNMTAEETRAIFESVANAGGKLKLSSDQIQGTFLALSQMLSKGKVQAEELRGQLGERLPGAFALAAKAMGVTEKELNKMLEQGQVVADEFLPNFARQLDESFGNDKTQRIESMQASVNRLKTEWDLLFKSGTATSFYTFTVDGLASILASMNGSKDATRDLAQEHENLKTKFEQSYRDAVYLAREYDILTGKTSLNKDEQHRLKDVIQQMAALMPNAVTEWNRFGEAIDINRVKVQELTDNMRELQRVQNKGIVDELNANFEKSQRTIDARRRTMELKQKQISAPNASEKFIRREEQLVVLIKDEIIKDQGDSYEAAKALRDIGAPLSKAQKDVIAYHEKTQESGEITYESIKKNKEYWDDQVKSIKGSIDALEVSKKGTKEWIELTKQYEVAKKNADAYNINSDMKRGLRDHNKEIADAKRKEEALRNILTQSANQSSLSLKEGIARDIEAVDQKYKAWYDTAKGNAEAIEQLERDHQSQVNQIKLKGLNDALKFQKDSLDKVRKLAKQDVKTKRKQDSHEVEVDIVFDRRFNETAGQRSLRILNTEFRKLVNEKENAIRKSVELGQISKQMGQAMADAYNQAAQNEYWEKLESVRKKDIETQLAMVDGRNIFNESLAKTNVLLDELDRKFQAGLYSKEQYQKLQASLLNQQELVGALKSSYDQMSAGVGNAFANMLTQGQSFGEGMEQVFRQMVATIISEMAKLAAIKLLQGIFGVATGGASTAITNVLPGFVGGYANGGYTGNVAINKVAGVVHGKEYVFDADATRRIGVNNLEALRSGNIPTPADLTPKIAKNFSTFNGAPTGASGVKQRLDVNVIVEGDVRNDRIRLSNARGQRNEKKFGRG
ncbi:tape measure protein [Sphingobacterium corticis]|uniref:Tape measure protein n=1 Tax=Sphingobacterium corticis TaxID=1812823 RepID=A0ABW5NFS8_9SPHI